MPHNYYSEINLHLVWHTKDSLPLLTPTVSRYYIGTSSSGWSMKKAYMSTRSAAAKRTFNSFVDPNDADCRKRMDRPIERSVGHEEANPTIGTSCQDAQWRPAIDVLSFRGLAELDWVKAYCSAGSKRQTSHSPERKTFDR